MADFASEGEYVAEVVRRLSGTGASHDALMEMALCWDGLQKKALEPEYAINSRHGAINTQFRYIIADDDLKAFDSFVEAVKAAAATNFFLSSTPTSNAAAIVVGFLLIGAKLFVQAKKYAAKVTPEQLRVLLVLKDNRPKGLRIEELAEILARPPAPMTMPDIVSALDMLKLLARNDGIVKPFVAKDGAERWHAAGV